MKRWVFILSILLVATAVQAQKLSDSINPRGRNQGNRIKTAISANEDSITAHRADIPVVTDGVYDGNVGRLIFPDSSIANSSDTVRVLKKYSLVEKMTGIWVNGDTVYTKTVDLGNLPNATTKNVAHGITGLSQVIRFYGAGYNSGVPNWIPIPYATSGDLMSVIINATNISLVTAQNLSALTGTLTIEYTK